MIAATVLALTLVPAAHDDADAKKVLEALQGVWKPTALTKEGRPARKSELNVVITIKSDKISIVEGTNTETVWFTLDPRQTPAAIDLTDGKGKLVARGVYKLEGSTLTICHGLDGGERPRDFAPDKTNGTMVLERVKKP